jgi:hypothetical protein
MTRTAQTAAPESIAGFRESRTPGGDRRRSLRVPLHWKLYVACRGTTHPRQTETRDVSRDGFYCILDAALAPGEWIDCDLVIPAHVPDSDETLSLRCRAQVIRVERMDDDDRFGLACRIEDYRLVRRPAAPRDSAPSSPVELMA